MSVMTPLTSRQAAILEFIQASMAQSGLPPTIREIARHFRLKSPSAVAKHLARLRDKGVLSPAKGRSRGALPTRPVTLFTSIPVFGHIPAGAPSAQSQGDEGCIRVDLESIGLPKNARTFALKVRGDSMIGAGILDRDIVILEFKSPHDGAVVAALVDGETTLKRYFMRRGQPCLRAENPRYPDIIPARELVIQGVMVALVRKA
ncbi:MAG: transcriptional repressor LexA [Candidatus Methylacidiphilales bacterium]|nr:transcriptional repressor LexA [Candidatus Methylacidiphilales bacterium]